MITVALKTAGFSDWPETHKTPVLRYFNAILDNLINSEQSSLEIDSWMCALGRLFTDVSPFLNRLYMHPKKVVEYYEVNSESLIKGRLVNSFWDDSGTDAYKQIIDWFNSREIQSMIKSHYGI